MRAVTAVQSRCFTPSPGGGEREAGLTTTLSWSLSHNSPVRPGRGWNRPSNKVEKQDQSAINYNYNTAFTAVYQALRGLVKKDGTKRMPPTQERIAEFNSDIEAETVEVAEDSRDLERSEDVVVGDDILRIPQSTIQNYNLHFPFRRGDLNLHSDVGGSLTSILVGQSRCRCVSSVYL